MRTKQSVFEALLEQWAETTEYLAMAEGRLPTTIQREKEKWLNLYNEAARLEDGTVIIPVAIGPREQEFLNLIAEQLDKQNET